MKDAGLINVKYMEQAVNEMNMSYLFTVKIKLGDELKNETLKVFMENVEAVPVEKEEEIPPKIVEMYNFIFDDEYQIPEGIFEEEAKVEETTETKVEAVEAPVKEKKVKEPKPPKEPKEVKERKPRPTLAPGELSRKQKVYAKWVENKEMLPKEMLEICPDLNLKTMVSWRYSWKKGTNLPKGATV